jgi:hypothetical protein
MNATEWLAFKWFTLCHAFFNPANMDNTALK